jgi:hypothetical protein
LLPGEDDAPGNSLVPKNTDPWSRPKWSVRPDPSSILSSLTEVKRAIPANTQMCELEINAYTCMPLSSKVLYYVVIPTNMGDFLGLPQKYFVTMINVIKD